MSVPALQLLLSDLHYFKDVLTDPCYMKWSVKIVEFRQTDNLHWSKTGDAR